MLKKIIKEFGGKSFSHLYVLPVLLMAGYLLSIYSVDLGGDLAVNLASPGALAIRLNNALNT